MILGKIIGMLLGAFVVSLFVLKDLSSKMNSLAYAGCSQYEPINIYHTILCLIICGTIISIFLYFIKKTT